MHATLPSEIDPADLTELICDCHDLPASLCGPTAHHERGTADVGCPVIDDEAASLVDGLPDYGG